MVCFLKKLLSCMFLKKHFEETHDILNGLQHSTLKCVEVCQAL